MPPKKESKKKKRVRRAPKKGLKQKQKQRQVVNVQVSAGGAGGGGFIPIPQAPSIDYSLLSNLLRPANVVDTPMRAAAPMAERLPARAAETQTLLEEFPRPSRRAPAIPIFAETGSSTENLKKPFIATPSATDFQNESEGETGFATKKKGRPIGSKNKPRPIAVAVPEQFMGGGEFERMMEAQKSGSFM